MARANLSLDSSVIEAFLQAQEGPIIRIIKVVINEENLSIGSIINHVGTASEDFDTLLLDQLNDREASLVLFCLSDNVSQARKWILLAWVPDGCRVRDKMLYSSSREDLKRSLGLGYFVSEYAANVRSDVTWSQLQVYLNKANEKVFTDKELLIQEEKALASVESVSSKSSAMNLLPFDLTEEVSPSLQAFFSSQVNWVTLSIIKREREAIHVEGKGIISGPSDLASTAHPSEPRFYLARFSRPTGGDLVLFLYCCPEASPLKMKMTYSSSKATVLSILAEHDIRIEKTFEVRGTDEIVDCLTPELTPSPTPSSSISVAPTSSKPSRPGKGKARVAKFQSDEDI